ncbi:glycosyltransferase [Cupriavidus sp. UYPR2.512]|uniref:glycosyltransferase n=1 Tax=Cupriavidus sp. UYPR2.512 TaxID=1080187 RepID=UPI00039F117D|nr:glycosyltransferase [Cupriavidus sp. UYPR2.512]UIF87976.1 hypothetical protein KAF44_22090 [Cupriavidus necator]
MNAYNRAIFVSFDAVAVSGITVEAIKIAKVLSQNGIKSYLDLGYDIKIDKGMFNKPYEWEKELYKDIFTLVRIDDISSIANYNVDFIKHAHDVLIRQSISESNQRKEYIKAEIIDTSQHLSHKIVQLWGNLNIGYVIVENGTLPENIVYTQALYLAIEEYGNCHGLGNFVIWRDHDLMWSSEKSAMKYGPPPYPNAIKPIKSSYITYVTLNNDLKSNLEEWCNYTVDVKVKKNTYEFNDQVGYKNLREDFSIRDDDLIIARTTRIIPQKRLDRDIYVINRVNQLFIQNDIDRKALLFVAGDPNEDAYYYQQLVVLSKKLNAESAIKFLGSLHHRGLPSQGQMYTIDDLYYSCDLVSFLTSWDYDSYGNPIGEAISHQRCYITTSYEYYDEVYGQHGFIAPIMKISEGNDGLPDENFIDALYKLINNKQLMKEIAKKNYLIGRQLLSSNISDIFDLNFGGVYAR